MADLTIPSAHVAHHAVHKVVHHVVAAPLPPVRELPPAPVPVEPFLNLHNFFLFGGLAGLVLLYIFVLRPKLDQLRSTAGIYTILNSVEASLWTKVKPAMTGQWAFMVAAIGFVVALAPDIFRLFGLNFASWVFNYADAARFSAAIFIVVIVVTAISNLALAKLAASAAAAGAAALSGAQTNPVVKEIESIGGKVISGAIDAVHEVAAFTADHTAPTPAPAPASAPVVAQTIAPVRVPAPSIVAPAAPVA